MRPHAAAHLLHHIRLRIVALESGEGMERWLGWLAAVLEARV